MHKPPSAGPAMVPTLPRSEASAAVAGSSSRATRRGAIASSVGRWKPLTADMRPVITKMTAMLG